MVGAVLKDVVTESKSEALAGITKKGSIMTDNNSSQAYKEAIASITCPECGHKIYYTPKLSGNIRSFEFTQYITRGKWIILREALPDEDPESVPALYFEQYGELLPADWRNVINDKR